MKEKFEVKIFSKSDSLNLKERAFDSNDKVNYVN